MFLLLFIMFLTIVVYFLNFKTCLQDKNLKLYNLNCKSIFQFDYDYLLYNTEIKYTNYEVSKFIGMFSRDIIKLLDSTLSKIKFCTPSLNKNSNFEVLRNNNFIPAPVYKIKFVNSEDLCAISKYKIIFRILNELNIKINLVCIASNELYFKIKNMFPIVFNYDFIDYELLANINAFNINKEYIINDTGNNTIEINNKKYKYCEEKERYIEYVFDDVKILRTVDIKLSCMIYSIKFSNSYSGIVKIPIYLPKSLYKVKNTKHGLIITDIYNNKEIKVYTHTTILTSEVIIKGDFSLLVKFNTCNDILIVYNSNGICQTFESCIKSFDNVFQLRIKSIDPHLDYIFNVYLRKVVIQEFIKDPFTQYEYLLNILLHKECKPVYKQHLNVVYINKSLASYYYNYIFSVLLGIKQINNIISINPSNELWLNQWQLKYKINNKNYTIYLERNIENKPMTNIDSVNIHNSTVVPLSILEKSFIQIKY